MCECVCVRDGKVEKGKGGRDGKGEQRDNVRRRREGDQGRLPRERQSGGAGPWRSAAAARRRRYRVWRGAVRAERRCASREGRQVGREHSERDLRSGVCFTLEKHKKIIVISTSKSVYFYLLIPTCRKADK